MMKNQMIKERVQQMPAGMYSDSNKYWCVTCKLLFNLDKPVCPYMPQMCINTPIPVEEMGPESTVSIEKFGLFYPKIPQKMMNYLAVEDLEEIGKRWALAYLEFLEEWRFEYKHEPLQTLKSFIITVSGSETAERITPDGILFIITDLKKVWDREKLFPILEASLATLKEQLDFNRNITFDTIDIIGEKEVGKYYCPMCKKFFEFSSQRDSITCPLMPQKCVAVPRRLDRVKYSLADLVSIYGHTPDIYSKFLSSLPLSTGWKEYLEGLLREEWQFTVTPEAIECIASQIGLTDKEEACLPEFGTATPAAAIM